MGCSELLYLLIVEILLTEGSLAMAEMTTLLASIYRKYETEIAPEFQESSPGVTARYEVFSDEHFSEVKEHQCWVKFVPDLTL